MGRLWKTYRKVNPAKHEVTFAEAEANSYGHGSLFRGENDKAAGYGYAVLSLARMIHTLQVCWVLPLGHAQSIHCLECCRSDSEFQTLF